MAQAEPCEVTVQWKSKLKRNVLDLIQAKSGDMVLGASDPRMLPVVPYMAGGKIFVEDEYLCVALECVAQDGISTVVTDSTVKVPVTMKDLQSGRKWPAMMGLNGQYAFTALANDTVFDASEKKEWLYFRIPRGMKLVVGHENQFNSRLNVTPKDDT